MGLFGHLLGHDEGAGGPPEPLAANEAQEELMALQVLLPGRLAVDEHGLSRALHAYDREMREARVELTQDEAGEAVLGLAGWGRHVVRLVGINAPVPLPEVEWCHPLAPLPPEREARVRAHGSHLLLVYTGYEEDPLEQYVALAAVAGALVVSSDALLVLNEPARAAVPARELASQGPGALAHLRALPLLGLYVGAGRVEEVPGGWVRTFGAGKLGLPDVALRGGEREEREALVQLAGLLAALRPSRGRAVPGHACQVGAAVFRLREPRPGEPPRESGEGLLVAEPEPALQRALS